MKKNYLLMAAAAMLLASCSNEADGPKNEDNNVNEDVFTLTTLAPNTQAGRISAAGNTRDGEKKDRLQLQYEIAPVAAAQTNNWSATSVVLGNNGVYVTWHSNLQATDPALKWGGALDVIDVSGETPTFSNTYVNYQAKFNTAISGNGAFYIALTDVKKGAAVARVAYGATTGVVRKLTGSSANALELKDGRVYAACGFNNGGVFSIGQDFPAAADGKARIDTVKLINGCKYIDGDLVLGTSETAAFIYNMATEAVTEIGAPLTSEEKFAEEASYDPALDRVEWNTVGNKATYYGKHTMAVDGDYIYVAGGQAEAGSENGLRVYEKSTLKQVWGNATNTTAVCVAGKYVYAATGAGLRVYEKKDGGKLELFAFESIPAVDENGNAVLDKEGNQKYEAGTTAHSCNYVAVDGDKIYVACGQTGVRVFKLDTTAPAEEETPAE